MATIHLIIKGKVQGVFFRASAKDIANEIGVTGWIKNTGTGDVEALVTGNEQQLKEFVAWSRQGPPRANVAEVISTTQEETSFKDFSVIR